MERAEVEGEPHDRFNSKERDSQARKTRPSVDWRAAAWKHLWGRGNRSGGLQRSARQWISRLDSVSPAPAIVAFEKAFAEYVGTKHAVAINSAGPGLDMVMRYLNLQPGDEVIVPAINFMAAPLAVVGAGGQVVWGEIDPRTFQLDPEDVEKRITPRTRAIFPVHMNGLSAPMDELIEVGNRHTHDKHGPIPVIGDGARACGGGYKGTKIGKKGILNVFSFHTMKNMVTLGEGGMITTDDDDIESYCRSDSLLWNRDRMLGNLQCDDLRPSSRRFGATFEDGFLRREPPEDRASSP